MLQIRFMSLRQWSGPFVEIWIGDYFLAEGRLDSFAGGCTCSIRTFGKKFLNDFAILTKYIEVE
jgi:hypothetical protein